MKKTTNRNQAGINSKVRWRRMILSGSVSLALLVAAVTTIRLIMPAVALTKQVQRLDCAHEVHTHDASCYAKVTDEDGNVSEQLICGKADYVIHVHNDDCYEEETYFEIVDGEEVEVTDRVLTCPLPETEPHVHDASCYETLTDADGNQYEELTCDRLELHTHTKDCYEKGHNGDPAYLTCGQLELAEHVHGGDCLYTETVEIEEPAEETDENAADPVVFEGNEELSAEEGVEEGAEEGTETGLEEGEEAGLEEGAEGSLEEGAEEVTDEEIEEGTEEGAEEGRGEDTEEVAEDGAEEGKEWTEDGAEAREESEGSEDAEADGGSVVSSGDGAATAGADAERPETSEAGSDTETETGKDGDKASDEDVNSDAEKEYNSESEKEVDAAAFPAQTFEQETENVRVKIEAPVGALPAGTELIVTDVFDEATIDTIKDAVGDKEGEKVVHAADITFKNADGEEIEPLLPITVVMEAIEPATAEDPVIVHVDDAGNAEQVEEITIAAGENSEISGADCEADSETAEVQEEGNGKEAVPEESGEEAAGFDDEIKVESDNTEGEVTQNEETSPADDGRTEEDSTEEGSESSDSVSAETADEEHQDEEPSAVTFVTADFSVYALVYTVDFHYEINGKIYEFSIPGGGFVSLEHVVEMLGMASADENRENEFESAGNGAEIADDVIGEVPGTDVSGENGTVYKEAIRLNEVEVSQAAKKFVADVEDVEFSSPELVWVGKAVSETTVGGLKEANGLEVEYSAELTEEQILEINSSTVEAGDWALISMQPFTSEETLTVTMKNGDQFVVKVTDDNVTNADDLVNGEEYILYIISSDGNYFALRDDGATLYVENNDLDRLDGHYRWVYTKNGVGAIWTCNGYKVNPYLAQQNWYNSYWGDATLLNPNWTPTTKLIPLSDGGFKFEDLNHSDRYLAYYTHNSGTDVIRTKWDSGKNDVISIHIYKPGTAYTVHLESNNDEFGSVQYTQGSTTVRTSSSTHSISVDTEKNEEVNKTVPVNIVAVPRTGYKFTGWTVEQVNSWNDYKVIDWGPGASSESAVIKPTVNGELTLKADFEPEKLYTFTVRTNNEEMGTVGGGNRHGDTVNGQIAFQSITGAVINDKGRNAYKLTAKNLPLHKFVEWRLTNSHGDVVRTIDSLTIEAKDLELTEDGMTLTAVFQKKADTEISEEDIDTLLDSWKNEMDSDFVGVDKTAHVHDYENRIYEINLSASSGKWAVEQSVNLDFITDTSRSMFFPANLDYAINSYSNETQNKNASSFSNLKDWLNNNGDTEETYYVVSKYTASDTTATMFAVYYTGSKWEFVDSSFYYNTDGKRRTSDKISEVPSKNKPGSNDTGYAVLSGKELSGIIYKSSKAPDTYQVGYKPNPMTQYWSRLDYLYKAVMTATETLKSIDPNANVHLTTFNGASANKGTLGNTESEVYGTLTDIAPDGGTRQDRGLWTARTGKDRSTSQDPDLTTGVGSNSAFYDKSHQNFAILITDGAPNGTNWTDIGAQADKLKAIKDNNNNPLTLMTLGLGLNFVGTENKQGLTDIASGAEYAEEANNGGQIVNAIKALVQSMAKKADLFGKVSDTLDPAFYPVKSDGSPIAPGYYTMNGDVYTPHSNDSTPYCCWEKNGEVWTVTYFNQTIGWPERDDNGNITENGWEQVFHVKAKENFFGGNTIETNQGTSFTATHTILLDDNGQERPGTKKEIKDKDNKSDPIVKSDIPTPHVNVKQLTLDSNDSKWTVYTETMVYPPIDQIKELFNIIKVAEVVESSADNMITSNTVMLFDPGTGTEPETFLLKDAITVTEDDWEDLAGIDGGDGTVDVPYTLYGHTPGVIRLTLEKSGGKADYSAHETSDSPNSVEEYVLTAQYVPYSVEEMQQNDTDGGEYHTTRNKSGGAVQMDGKPSENTHVIEIFTRGLSITKADDNFANGLPGAEFTVYRPATEEERTSTDPAIQAKLRTFEGDSDIYFADHELDFDDNGVAFKNGVKTYGPETKYYLVETKAPKGYALLEDPVTVTLTISETYTVLPAEEGSSPETQDTKPLAGLFGWTQEAKLEVSGPSDIIMRTTGSYDPEDGSTDLTDIAVTSSSEYEVLYYRIKNEALTTDITFRKVDENNAGLPGAVFQLMVLDDEGENPQTALTKPGYTAIVGLKDVVEGDITYSSAIKSDGKVQSIEKLPDGKYRLIEKVAPAGYIINKSEWNFEIKNGEIVSRDGGMGDGSAIVIANTPGATLPNTGGPGTNLIYLFGIMLTGLAGAGLVMRKRRRNAA